MLNRAGLGGLANVNSTDPADTLGYLSGAGTVLAHGREVVRDVDTTHYLIVIDLTEMSRQVPSSAMAVDRLVALLGQSTLGAEVWIDDDGLLRRMTMELPVPGQGRMRMLMELHDFGIPVDVVAPPPSEVFELQ